MDLNFRPNYVITKEVKSCTYCATVRVGECHEVGAIHCKCIVRTFLILRLCNQRVGYLQKLNDNALGPLYKSGHKSSYQLKN